MRKKNCTITFIELYRATGNKEKQKEYQTAYLQLENQQLKSQLKTATQLIKHEVQKKNLPTPIFTKYPLVLLLWQHFLFCYCTSKEKSINMKKKLLTCSETQERQRNT